MGRLGFVLAVGALATALGLATGLTVTVAGRGLLARVVTDHSRRLVRGTLEIGELSGNFLTALVLDSVTVRDTSGAVLAVLPRVEARYSLANLLAGRVVLDQVVLDRPRIHLRKRRDGRLNIEEILGLGEGAGGGPSPLILFRNVAIRDGILTIRLPWSPPGHLRTGAQRDSALQAQRRTPGRRIEEGGRDGLLQLRTVEGLEARFSEVRISTPDGAPIRVVVDSLAARLNDPLLVVTDARGELTAARDTLRFTLRRAALPGSRLEGEGLLAWPRDTLLFNFAFEAPELALADFRFVSFDFPDFTGRGRVSAFSVSGLETQYDLPGLDLRDSESRVSGSLVARAHKLRGLGFRNLDLQLTNLDLEVVRPYLDTLPFVGRLSGSLRADGFFDDLRVAFDWLFADSRVAGAPPNRIAMEGLVALGGGAGLVFRETQVTAADLDLPTVRLAAPAVILEGRMTGEGVLDGPWRDVEFRGRMEHRDGNRPESMASGRFALDTRGETTVFDGDFAVAPLAFEGIRRSFPSLTAEGRVWGPVRLRGPLDSLFVQADLQGELGRVRAHGTVTATPPRWGADTLWLGFEDLDLAQARGAGPATRLTGEAVVRGVVDSATPPDGTLRVALQAGVVREFAIDSADAAVAVEDGVLRVDTAEVRWAGGLAAAAGSLGWSRPRGGALRVGLHATSLTAFDSLLVALADVEADTTTLRQPLDGSLVAQLELGGARDSLEGRGEFTAVGVRWNRLRIPRSAGRMRWTAGPDASLQAEVEADSLLVGRLRFAGVGAVLEGPRDALRWRTSATGLMTGGSASGRWRTADRRVLELDALALDLGASRWRLVEPTSVVLADSLVFLAPLRLATRTGSATLDAEGALPFRAPASLDLRLVGLDLRDLYSVLQRDTSQVRGFLQADLRVAGTGADPTIRGTAAVTGPVFGDFRGPLARAALNFRNRRLDANLTLWRTGNPVMDVSATLPITLAWLGVEGDRQLPGELAIRAQADSMDLAALEAFSTNLRRVRGTMRVDVVVSGGWDRPRLGGTLTVHEGAGTIPALGVSYGPTNGALSFVGDSIVVDSLRVAGETGSLDVEGRLRLDRLTRPVLDLSLTARSFRVMDVPGFLTLETDGNVRLVGPVTHPVMTGSATARNSVLYFSDLVTKEIVNLEDPLYADLVDREALRRRRLGAEFQSRFLDSLAIRDFRFLAAERVWLRSSEANIQLEGSVTVNKVRRNYRLEGTFNAPRGTYTLQLWPLPATRTFEVERGVVRYFNTPDLNADLDIEARHIVKYADAGGQDVAVTARIGGTLLTPRLTLASTIRPPLSQSDIVSLLLLGRPLNTQVATTQQNQVVQSVVAGLASAFTSELERSLVQGERGGLAMIEIRPGLAYSGIATGTSLTRLSAGWQLGNRWFVLLNAGFCPDFERVGYRNFGAGLEYRFSRSLLFSASAEPVQICLTAARSVNLRYQFGTDIRWVREY